VKQYLDTATRVNLKYKMPTRAILLQVHQLTNHLQLLLSHVEQLKPGASKLQKEHVAAIRKATKGAVAVMGRIQNLANIELEEQQ
jgi:DNA-binding transcriptional regulator YdaS (Cro superfamily)